MKNEVGFSSFFSFHYSFSPFYPEPFILSIIPSKKLKNYRRGGLKEWKKDGKIHESIN